MDKEELKKNGIKGIRLNVALMLRSKPYDILMILLIIAYTVLIFLFFALEDTKFAGNN